LNKIINKYAEYREFGETFFEHMQNYLPVREIGALV
jgi:hypothetical protein